MWPFFHYRSDQYYTPFNENSNATNAYLALHVFINVCLTSILLHGNSLSVRPVNQLMVNKDLEVPLKFFKLAYQFKQVVSIPAY